MTKKPGHPIRAPGELWDREDLHLEACATSGLQPGVFLFDHVPKAHPGKVLPSADNKSARVANLLTLLVEDQGIEPWHAGSEPAVLPLHQSSVFPDNRAIGRGLSPSLFSILPFQCTPTGSTPQLKTSENEHGLAAQWGSGPT